jgi:hypothetical protein
MIEVLSILKCGSKLIRIEDTKLPKPLNTERTTIRAATPIVTPIMDIAEMIETNFILFLLSKYLRAIWSSYFIRKILTI